MPLNATCWHQMLFLYVDRVIGDLRIKFVRLKECYQVTHPLELLIMSLIKGYIDDEDLTAKIQDLYKAPHPHQCHNTICN
jgi:hypothetical protein